MTGDDGKEDREKRENERLIVIAVVIGLAVIVAALLAFGIVQALRSAGVGI